MVTVRLETTIAGEVRGFDPEQYLEKKEARKADRHGLIETLKGLRVPVTGTEGFDKAEVTAGGLDLDVVDPRTMRVKGHPGLAVIGELLDRSGPIGGLNFQINLPSSRLRQYAWPSSDPK